MMKPMKRSLALVMALVMCLSLLPALFLNVGASEVTYKYDSTGKYIYNWGTRGEVATYLSPNAEAFYQENDVTFDELSALTGGTNESTVPDSALYEALHELMESNHSHKTDYDETRSLYQYTDSQKNGAWENGAISCFYTGNKVGPAWDSGSTWNREHTWPQSKGGAGSDEDDIMMLRPAVSSVNSSRGNKAYGQSSGYYNPNSENSNLDLRGDVARIFLYVYVRWEIVDGNGESSTTGAYTTWGTNGVMESIEVLLAWMAADPVDTWELGRNDSVESITGTRNVFVDYPELAFLLFSEDVPANYTTPSGEGDGACDHNNFDAGVVTAPGCETKGYTTFTCQTEGCNYSYKANFVDAKGHNYVDGICSVCQAAKPVEPAKPAPATEIVAGKPYKLGMFSTAKNADYYFTGAMSGYYGATVTNYEGGVDVYAEETTGGYYLYFFDASNAKQYISLAVSGTHKNFVFGAFDAASTSVFTWDADKDAFWATLDGTQCYMGTYGNYVTVGVLSSVQDTDYIARFYTIDAASGDEGEGDTCEHSYAGVVTAPTCTEGGFTTYTCSKCGDSYVGDKVAATGHDFTNGDCACGEKKPAATTSATITFDADKTNRTEYSTSKQVWVQNGITVTNNKGASTSNVGDYTNPGRFYKSSQVIISYPGMTKIEINVGTLAAQYTDGWLSVPEGATATKNGQVIVIELAAPADTFTYEKMSAQSRAYSITVYAAAQSTDCEHTEIAALEGRLDATCTTDGHTGKTVCADCGAILDEGSVIPALGHDYVDGICSVCQAEEPTEPAYKPAPVTEVVVGRPYKLGLFSTSKNADYFFTGVMSGFYGATDADYAKGVDFYAEAATDGFYLYFLDASGAKQYINLVASGTHRNFTFAGTATSVFTWDAERNAFYTTIDGEICYMGTYGTYVTVGVLQSSKLKDTDYIARFYSDVPPCEHTNTTVVGKLDATCTVDGHTGATVCSDCGKTVDEGSVITAPGHSYSNYVCGSCGAEDPDAPEYTVYFIVPGGVDAVASMVGNFKGITLPTAKTVEGYTFLGWAMSAVGNTTEAPTFLKAGDTFVPTASTILYALYTYEVEGEGGGEPTSGTATISFADKAQRTVFTSTQQVWEQNGIVVTNDKASSTNPVGDYANPARFYANSKLTIAHPGMTKIVITCGSSTYATNMKNSIGSAATASGSTVTVTFSTPTDSLVAAKMTAQSRVNSIKIEYTAVAAAEPVVYYTTVIGENACDHATVEIVEGNAPTCTEAGCETKVVCSKCQADVAFGKTVAAKGHTEIAHEGKDPTCTEGGWKAYVTCADCNYTTYEELAATGHTEISHEAKAPTCTEPGYDAYVTCEHCDYTTKVEIPATGHTEIGHEGKTPTCTEKGWKPYVTCANCNYTTYEELAEQHSEIAHEGKAPTCTEKGWKPYVTCELCDYTTYEELTAAHTEVAHDAKAPTCTEGGWKAYVTCANCDYTTYEAVPAAGHTEVSHAAKAPTCTEGGWKAYVTCANCDYTTYEAVPAAGHSHVAHSAKAATCTEKGWKAYVTCSKCNYTTYEEIAATGHSEIENSGRAATCTEKGWKEYVTCTKCDYTTYEEIPAKGHTEVEHAAKAPTCTASGWDAYVTCQDCNYTTYEMLPATGHNDADVDGECDACGKVVADVPFYKDMENEFEDVKEDIEEKLGCAGTISGSAIALFSLVISAGAAVMLKKKEDQ